MYAQQKVFTFSTLLHWVPALPIYFTILAHAQSSKYFKPLMNEKQLFLTKQQEPMS